jgi:hypothetical protein
MSLTRAEVDTIEDQDSAARAWLELEHERQQPGTPHGRLTENKAATQALEERFPGAREHAATASSEQLGGLSPRLKRTRDAHRRNVGVSSKEAARRRTRGSAGGGTLARRPSSPPRSSGGAPRRATASSHSRAGGRGRGGVRQALDVADTIAPVGVSYGRLAFQAAGWAIGLSLLYLLLSNSEKAPRGNSAVELIARGVTNTVNALVSPLADPLSPSRAAAGRARPASAGGVPIQQAGESGAAYDKRLGAYLMAHPPKRRPTSGAGVLGAPPLGALPRSSP